MHKSFWQGLDNEAFSLHHIFKVFSRYKNTFSSHLAISYTSEEFSFFSSIFKFQDFKYNLGEEDLPCMYEALGLIPTTVTTHTQKSFK